MGLEGNLFAYKARCVRYGSIGTAEAGTSMRVKRNKFYSRIQVIACGISVIVAAFAVAGAALCLWFTEKNLIAVIGFSCFAGVLLVLSIYCLCVGMQKRVYIEEDKCGEVDGKTPIKELFMKDVRRILVVSKPVRGGYHKDRIIIDNGEYQQFVAFMKEQTEEDPNHIEMALDAIKREQGWIELGYTPIRVRYFKKNFPDIPIVKAKIEGFII